MHYSANTRRKEPHLAEIYDEPCKHLSLQLTIKGGGRRCQALSLQSTKKKKPNPTKNRQERPGIQLKYIWNHIFASIFDGKTPDMSVQQKCAGKIDRPYTSLNFDVVRRHALQRKHKAKGTTSGGEKIRRTLHASSSSAHDGGWWKTMPNSLTTMHISYFPSPDDRHYSANKGERNHIWQK